MTSTDESQSDFKTELLQLFSCNNFWPTCESSVFFCKACLGMGKTRSVLYAECCSKLITVSSVAPISFLVKKIWVTFSRQIPLKTILCG